MKKAVILVVTILAFCHVYAQDVGVMHPYPENPEVETPVPAGYKPFYMSHFSRHGSRYHSSEKLVLPALEALRKGNEQSILTPEGKFLLEKAEQLYSLSDGMWGQLSSIGVEEHKHIAARMVKRCPSVFKDSVRVMASIYPRCIMSMASSTGEIARLSPKTKWSYVTGKRYQSIINTNHRPPDWVSGASSQKAYLKEKLNDSLLISRIFTDPVRGEEIVGKPYAFFKSVYNIWADRDAIRLEPFDLESIFGKDAVMILTRADNLAHYRNMAIPNADSLIVDIISRADAALAAPKPSADLRYGHDNGLMRLFVQIGMEGYPVGLANDEAALFSFADKMPMATNLQMVFYKNRKGQVLVKFLVNERERAIDNLPGGPYYDWDILKNYLSSCLSEEYIENNQ